ncbi:MAG: hypothetical protein IJ122_07915 [Methanobrevibacter sp.]|nr:hypothetical protein [Methanobrevibacter sp.]
MDFKKNRVNTTKNLKILYPTPKNLTDDERRFLIMWGIDSFPLLSYLRSKNDNPQNHDSYLEFFNENIQKAINKYDNIKINSILHRRVFDDFFIEDENEIGILNTPLSTTFDSNSNLEFGDYHIEILAPIGTNGAYIEELMFNEHYYQHLNEWILPQNTIYKTLLKDYELKKAIIIILGDGINEF